MGFVFIVLGIIFGIHSTFVALVWYPKLDSLSAFVLLLVYHFFFMNLILSFYQCVMTDPGVVPPNWGFYMGDETKRRRYCKMCNVWKPDRTHHCSICNRCILNMDHHCPWINNCVGFYNRKFFIQLLVYVYLSLSIVVLFSFWDFLAHIGTCFGIWPFHDAAHEEVVDTWYIIRTCLITLAWIMSVLLIGTLTNFIKFHVNLVLDNYTTIENLEREENAKCKFDIGKWRNLEQVFGPNIWMWWLPMHTQASRPAGDGVRWRMHYTQVIDEDE
jgi:palmitoyltransferase